MRQIVATLLAVAGCHGSGTQPVVAPDMSMVPAFAAHDKVDILFMMDNSPGEPYKSEVVHRSPQLFQALQNAALNGHPASYHIGVVTSDLGAGPFVLNQGQCHPDGDGGKLQVMPAGVAPGVPPACANFMLTGGARYIDYDQVANTTNTGATDVATAFECMATDGDGGCGFEHQLESTYRALHDPPAENAGFLRDDALLVVFFATDEDDCSAPPDTDLFDPSAAGLANYGALHSFRCTEWGITCGEPPMLLSPTMATAPRDDCRPLTMAEGGKLFDVQRYIDFFARPGGVKADPSDVILAAVAAPPTPIAVSLTMPCADQVNVPTCPILNHSCVAPANPQFFGDPGMRIAAVVDAAYTSQRTSLCETDYSPAIAGLAQKIIARLR